MEDSKEKEEKKEEKREGVEKEWKNKNENSFPPMIRYLLRGGIFI